MTEDAGPNNFNGNEKSQLFLYCIPNIIDLQPVVYQKLTKSKTFTLFHGCQCLNQHACHAFCLVLYQLDGHMPGPVMV